MTKKKIIHPIILSVFTLVIVGMPMGINLVKAKLTGGSGNDRGYKEATTVDCPTCPYTIPSTSEYYLNTQTGTKITVAVEIDGKVYSVDKIITPSDNPNVVSPLRKTDGGLETNPSYKDTMDSYLNDNMIVNGEYNENFEVIQMVIEAAEQSGACSGSTCLTLLEEQRRTSANSEGNAMNDFMDVRYEPQVTVCPNGDCNHKYMESACEAANMEGIRDVGKAAKEAVHAGTDETYSDVKKGDSGIGTFDATDKFKKTDCVGSCGCGDNCTWETVEVKSDWKYEPGKPPADRNIPNIVKEELPENQESGGSCGENFSQTTYEEGPAIDSCGLAHYIIETRTTINVPGNAGSMFAGQSMNWGGITSAQTVDMYPNHGFELISNWSKTENEKIAIQEMVDYYASEIETAQVALDSLKAAWAKCEQQKTTCPAPYSWDCGNYGEDGNWVPKNCNNSSDIAECEATNTKNYNNCTANLAKVADMEVMVEAKKIAYNAYLEQNQEQLNNLTARAEELKGCVQEYQQVAVGNPIETKNNSGVANVSTSTLTINGQSQSAGSITAVNKGNGSGSTSVNNNSFPLTGGSNFHIPPSTPNGTTGTLTETITLPNGTEFTLSCTVDVLNTSRCTSNCGTPSNPTPGGGGGKSKGGNLNLIYRPISLTDPFPNKRKAITSWQDSLVVESIISNNRGVKDYEVYNLKPMYDITLTPTDIKDIRNYNKKHSYNDFTLNCTKGLYCKSTFLREFIYDKIDVSNSCGLDSDWYACDTSKSVSNVKEDLFRYLK